MEKLDFDDISKEQKKRRSEKRRRWTIIVIIGLVLLTIGVSLIQSMIPALFEVMPLLEQTVYLAITYGLPLTMLLLALLLGAGIALLIHRGKPYLKRWMLGFRMVYLVLMSVSLVFMVSMQMAINDDTTGAFGEAKMYADVVPYEGSTEDLKTGVFYSAGGFKYERFDDYQVEYNPITGETMRFDLKWLNDAEYILIVPDEYVKIDTLFVKITENTPTYYGYFMSPDRKKGVYGRLEKEK